MKISSLRFENPFLIGLISAALAMLLYSLTVAPTFSWGDSADLAMRLVSDVDQSFVGTHRDYVLWRQVGQAAAWLPIQDAGLRANLFTAFWGAVTVGSVAAFVQVMSRSTFAAIAAACSLTVAHSFWLLSVIAEVYTFNAALVFLSFACIACWWDNRRPYLLWSAAFFSGLSLVHHATGLVLAASLIPLIAMRIRMIGLSTLGTALAIFMLTSLNYWADIFPRFGSDMGLLNALGLKMTQNNFFQISPHKEAIKFAAYLTFNFIGIGIFLGIIGFFQAIKNKSWIVLPPLLWASAFIYAGVTTSIPDKFNVYVLVYPSFAILVGLGTAWCVERFAFKVRGAVAILILLLLIPPLGYSTTVWASRTLGIDFVGARIAPLRDNTSYFLWPPKSGDYGPRIFAERVLSDAPTGAVLIADYTLWRPIYFVQAVESFRTDVEVQFVERLFREGVDNWIAQQPCERRVFLATVNPPQYYQLDRIEARFDLVERGSLYEVQRACH